MTAHETSMPTTCGLSGCYIAGPHTHATTTGTQPGWQRSFEGCANYRTTSEGVLVGCYACNHRDLANKRAGREDDNASSLMLPGERAVQKADITGWKLTRQRALADGWTQAENAIVAWLRNRGAHGLVPLSQAARDFADLIEHGDHIGMGRGSEGEDGST